MCKQNTILFLKSFKWFFYFKKKLLFLIKFLLKIPWPRTTTEKYLNEYFEGSSAQFIAILEALSLSHRRIFHTAEFDQNHEINEVSAELFFAAKEIIAGSFLY